MGRPSRYPDELRERAVRMVAEVRPQYPSQWAAISAVAGMLGIGTPETLRTWIRRSEVDTGQRPGVTSQIAEENKALRKEIAELRRANELLKAAAIFFGAELDRPGRRCSGSSPNTRTTRWPPPTVGLGCAGVSSPCAPCSASTVCRSARRPLTSGSPRPRRAGRSVTPSWSRSSLLHAKDKKTGKFVQTLGSRKLWI